MLKKKDEEQIINTLNSCKDFGNGKELYEQLQLLGQNLKKDKKSKNLVNFLEACGNQDRLHIIQCLKKQDRCVCELEAILQKLN